MGAVSRAGVLFKTNVKTHRDVQMLRAVFLIGRYSNIIVLKWVFKFTFKVYVVFLKKQLNLTILNRLMFFRSLAYFSP